VYRQDDIVLSIKPEKKDYWVDIVEIKKPFILILSLISQHYLKGGVALNTPVAASTKKRLDFLIPKVI
jgi:hypothetical protein